MGKQTPYKYNVGDVVNGLKIVEKIRIPYQNNREKTTYKGYKYCCIKDGYKGQTTESHLCRGDGCPVCSIPPKIILQGINDMWTTNSELAKLLADPEDGYKYTQQSHQRVDWKCPDCGNIIKNKSIAQINNYGLSCPVCSDGISYPNKLSHYLFDRLNIIYHFEELKYEYTPYWIRPNHYRYDVYFQYIKKYIVEMDGGYGHGHKDTKYLTKEKSKIRDITKDTLAKKYNIEVIRIDCDYEKQNKLSEFEYIKQSIFESNLSKIFDLTKIDWKWIEIKVCKSLLLNICQYRNNHINISTTKIAKNFNLSRQTIINYLKYGNKLNWCNYNPKEEQRNGNYKKHKINH